MPRWIMPVLLVGTIAMNNNFSEYCWDEHYFLDLLVTLISYREEI